MTTTPTTPACRDRSDAFHKAARALIADYDATAAMAGSPGDAGGTLGWPVLARGRGAVVTDVDGNEYVDYSLGGGAMILGYADERVVAAISKAASKGYGYGLPGEGELKLAELIAARYPAVDRVRFVAHTAEAMDQAIAVARHNTGRQYVVTFGGGHTGPLTADTDGAAPFGPLPYDDVQAIERVFAEHGAAIAAVLVEPVSTRAGVQAAGDEFLSSLRALCDQHGARPIFDQSATAFRQRSATLTVVPDLMIVGPVIGGGFPLAACAGRRTMFRDASGTANRGRSCPVNAVAAAAGVATLQALSDGEIERNLDATASRLADGLAEVVASLSAPVQVERVGSIVGLRFLREDSPANRLRQHAQFARAALDRGVYLPVVVPGCMFLSTAHGEGAIDRTIEALRDVIPAVMT